MFHKYKAEKQDLIEEVDSRAPAGIENLKRIKPTAVNIYKVELFWFNPKMTNSICMA